MNVNAVKHQAKRSENSDSHRIKARGKSATVWTLSISVSSAVSAPCAPQTQPSSNNIITEPVTQPETVPVAGSVASSAQNCPQETPVVISAPTPAEESVSEQPAEEAPPAQDGIYVPGFGYLQSEGPGEWSVSEGMYENGNKIGIVG